MARTFGCEDIGKDWCEWRMFVNDGEDDIIVEATLQHAEKSHPELAGNATQISVDIRSKISDLLRQSKYYEQKTLFGDAEAPVVDEDGTSAQVLPGLA